MENSVIKDSRSTISVITTVHRKKLYISVIPNRCGMRICCLPQSRARTIAATKLQPEDEVVNIRVVTENQHIVLQTADGFFLRFPAAEVTEKKKGAIGVRGIRLKKDDALTNVYLFEEGTECKISYHEKEVTLNRLKLAKRDGTGTKYRG